ncbi:putative heterogeneous nuclear ribonucleoprotein g protein [Botrytis cinerea BcDW1]|uniref:Uncharacterized protein n=2 Tax=Botryotinia fuckeliana TaxID=40559 RepID=G2YIB4_BOTF4|nr:putative heterogeneous nuclear ribonucleoprotein g protein [Botrytis cinerea BcDW1]CCD51451.1 hypothetical protein BofuT4_P017570.1 [Botrytis cinerea T4]
MSTKTQSRGSSPSMSSRPKLMRAHATAPSLVTGNASRKDLATLHASTKAASILTRVASYSAQQDHMNGGGSRRDSGSAYSTPGNRSPRSPESGSGLARSCKQELGMKGCSGGYQSAGYFSFPSFEDFQGYQEPNERMERKSVS